MTSTPMTSLQRVLTTLGHNEPDRLPLFLLATLHGATAICYFDPVSSPTIVPPDLYRRTGFAVAKRTLARIQGATATHMASGRAIPILGEIAQTGTAVGGVSGLEDLAEVKTACRGKPTVLGNLNGIEMRRWTEAEAEAAVRKAIAQAGPGSASSSRTTMARSPGRSPTKCS